MTLKFDGCTPLKGSVVPSGSVYSALTLITASVIFPEVTLENIPRVLATEKLLEDLEKIGVVINWPSVNTVTISAKELSSAVITSPALITPLLIRSGWVSLTSNLLSPKMAQFYKSLGVSLEETGSGLTTATFGNLEVVNIDAEYSLELSLTALLFSLKTIECVSISNLLLTEETFDTIDFLKELGLQMAIDAKKDENRITVTKSSTIETAKFSLPPSALESAFWASAVIMSGGDLIIKSVLKERLIAYFSKLSALGAHFEFDSSNVRVWRDEGQLLLPLDFEVSKEMPLYDFLPLLIPVLLLANGLSTVKGLALDQETYVKDLNLFNAKIVDGQILGPASLRGAKVALSSFVGGLPIILTALGSVGKNEILEVEKVADFFGGFGQKLEQLLGKSL